MYSSVELFLRSRESYFAWTARQEGTYIILLLKRHNYSIKDDKILFLTSTPCLTRSVYILLMTSQSIADDVTLSRQLWRDHANNDI